MNDRKNFYDEDMANAIKRNNNYQLQQQYQNNRTQSNNQRQSKKEKEIKEKSLSGSSGKRNNKKKKMSSAELKRRLRALLLVVMITFTGVIGHHVTTEVIPDTKAKIERNAAMSDFGDEVREIYMTDNVYRVNNNKDYAYRYDNIANRLNKSENFDRDLYVLSETVNYFNPDEVLRYTEYGNFDNYLEEKGFSSEEEYDEAMGYKVTVEHAIQEKEEELKEMQSDIDKLEEINQEHDLESTYSNSL